VRDVPAAALLRRPAVQRRPWVPGAAHFVRSVFRLVLAQGVSWLGSALLAVLLPRFLGDANLGRLGFALGLTMLAGLIANLGTGTFLAKEVARHPSWAGGLALNALVTRAPLVVAAVVVAAVVALGSRDQLTREVVYVLSGGIVVGAAFSVVQGALQGLQRMGTLAVVGALQTSVYAVAAAAVLFRGHGLLAVAGAYLAGQVAALLVSGVLLLRVVGRLPELDPGAWWRLCAGGLPFFVWQSALTVYGQIDSVLLNFLTGPAVVGWYVAAYRIVTIPVAVPAILVTVLFPALSAAAGTAPFDAITRRAVQVVVLVTLPMAMGVMLLADRIIAVLRYPAVFQHSVLPIMLLAPGFPLIAVDMILGTALNAHDRQRQWAATAVAAAVLNPALNLLAIPYAQSRFGNGAVGAAAVTTLTEVFMMSAGLWLLPRGVLDWTTASRCARCLVAAAAMSAVVLPLRHLPLELPVAAGAVTYSVASLALGTLRPQELRQVLGQLLRVGSEER
jgi:O-antigen/teichoic acid export membrane protein